jgi:hypothetical protein
MVFISASTNILGLDHNQFLSHPLQFTSHSSQHATNKKNTDKHFLSLQSILTSFQPFHVFLLEVCTNVVPYIKQTIHLILFTEIRNRCLSGEPHETNILDGRNAVS